MPATTSDAPTRRDTATTPGQFVTIITDEIIRDWHYVDDRGVRWVSSFDLRPLPPSVRTKLEKKHTKVHYTRRGREETLDAVSLMYDSLDYAIVAWRGVKTKVHAVPNDPNSPLIDRDLPCEREYKIMLPDGVRQAIFALCVTREQPRNAPQDEDDEIDFGYGAGSGPGQEADGDGDGGGDEGDGGNAGPFPPSPPTSTGSVPTATPPPRPAAPAPPSMSSAPPNPSTTARPATSDADPMR